MPLFDFPHSVPYRAIPSLGSHPAVDVLLFLNGRKTATIGLVDSGATVSAFGPDVALLLGIQDVREGDSIKVTTLGGSIDFHMFDLEMEIVLGGFRKRFPARVGFLPVRTNRNILGRGLIFSHFLIGFHEREQRLYFRPED